MRFTFVQVNHANHAAEEKKASIVNRALRVLEDPLRSERMAQCKCPACLYLASPRIVCHAFTPWTCQACEKEQPPWANSGVPRLCHECASRYGLCVECMADLDLRPRRKVTRSNKFRRAASSRR